MSLHLASYSDISSSSEQLFELLTKGVLNIGDELSEVLLHEMEG